MAVKRNLHGGKEPLGNERPVFSLPPSRMFLYRPGISIQWAQERTAPAIVVCLIGDSQANCANPGTLRERGRKREPSYLPLPPLSLSDPPV